MCDKCNNEVKNVYVEDEKGNLKKIEVDSRSARGGVNLICMIFGHDFNAQGTCIRCGQKY